LLAIVTLLLVGCLPALRGDSISRGDWPNYGNDAGGKTGTVLGSGELPASAQATPMTYLAPSGKQFVVIAAGGHTALETKISDYIIAFALP
jgi:glucose dehydrogenase